MDHKEILHQGLRRQRDALFAKLDGLPEREVRLPRTPTGTNLLGLLKHAATCELEYFGCLLYTSPSPRDRTRSRMPSSA